MHRLSVKAVIVLTDGNKSLGEYIIDKVLILIEITLLRGRLIFEHMIANGKRRTTVSESDDVGKNRIHQINVWILYQQQ